MSQKKIVYPAADRNKDPILSVLKQYIPLGEKLTCLEISSGTGQHLAHFAPQFPDVTFYPSEYDTGLLESIIAHTEDLPNVKKPCTIDVRTDFSTWNSGKFKEQSFDFVYNSNLIHVSPFECTLALFRNVGKLLKPNGMLITYGAYAIDGVITPESNVKFDRDIKAQNLEWGIRDTRELQKIAERNGMKLTEMVDMPANNKTLVWRKNPST